MHRYIAGPAMLLLAVGTTPAFAQPVPSARPSDAPAQSPAASPVTLTAPNGAPSAPNGTPSAPNATAGAPTDKDSAYQGYILGPNDTITVAVVGRTDFTTEAHVQEDGTISLPLIGQVNASGKSLLQLKSDIERQLKAGGYFRQPVVSITLTTPFSRYATVLGDVLNSGLVPLEREFHLSELVARAGGVKPGVDTVIVTTPDGQIREYSMRAITTSASPDPVIAPGTKVFVKAAPVYYVYGQTGSSGGFVLEPGMTVRIAIARAGGPSQLGTLKKIKIYRGDKTINHPDMGMKIEPNDTIYVGERVF